jgi:hypothetical protein
VSRNEHSDIGTSNNFYTPPLASVSVHSSQAHSSPEDPEYSMFNLKDTRQTTVQPQQNGSPLLVQDDIYSIDFNAMLMDFDFLTETPPLMTSQQVFDGPERLETPTINLSRASMVTQGEYSI